MITTLLIVWSITVWTLLAINIERGVRRMEEINNAIAQLNTEIENLKGRLGTGVVVQPEQLQAVSAAIGQAASAIAQIAA